MCMYSVTRTIEKPSSDERLGFKVFRKSKKSHTPLTGLSYHGYTTPYRKREWHRADTNSVLHSEDYENTYKSGFHCFQSKADAEEYKKGWEGVWSSDIELVVVPIRARYVTAEGTECMPHNNRDVGMSFAPAFIAREIYLPINRGQ